MRPSPGCLAWALGALLAATAAPARDNLVFSQLTVEHGLSQEGITAVVQDPYGFIWVGTQEGLNRYDGRRFEVFLNEPGNPNSLHHDWVTDLLVAADGRLWVGSRGGGLSVFAYARSAFEPFLGSGGALEGLDRLVVRCLHQDQSRVIWVGTDDDGLVRIDPAGSVSRLRHDPKDATSLSDDRVRDVVSDTQGRVWVATEGGGLNLWDDQTGKFEAFRHAPGEADTLSSDRLLSLFAAPDGTLWVGTYDAGLSVVNPFRRSVVRLGHAPGDFFSLSSNRVRVVDQDVDGRIWVGTDDGLDLWDPDRRGFHHYRAESGVRGSLTDNRITTLMQDRGGVLWVGTYAGLNNWNARVGSIEHYRREPEAPSSLSSDVITSFAEDRGGRLWVGTWGGGLNRLDLASGEVVHYRAGEGSLADDRVMSLLVDRDGRLWVGTLSSGLHLYHPDRETFTRYRHDPDDPASISANAITDIFQDSRGWIWVATFGGGLNRLHPDGTFTRYAAGPGRLSSNRVIDAAENDDGKLWLATDGGGVNVFDPNEDRFEHILPDPERSDSLASAAIVSVLITATDIWLGTRDSGLERLSQADYRAGRLSFRHYTRQTGLPSNAIQGVLEDDTGMIWLSSNKGISAITPENDRIRSFREPHGLQGAEFNSGAHYKAPDGTLYFGGNNGFNRFNPRNLFWSSNAYKPPVVLTGFTIFNQAVTFDRPLPEVSSIALNYSDYVVGFEFAALDYTNPEANRYRYRLEGLEDNWNDSGNIGRATYTNLAPGKDYVFRVQAANSDGIWSDQELAIAVSVRPPPWMTWWAYLVYALLALGVALAVSGLLIRRTRAQTEKRANERLRMYLHCLDEATDAVAILEPDGEIVYHNRALAEMLEHQAGGALRPSQLFDSEDSAHQALTEVAEHGRWQRTMPRPGRAAGSYLDLTLTQVGVEGAGTAIIAIARDATERKQTEDELKRYRDRLEMLVHKRTQELEQEIAEHKRTENQLRISLEEKELLLKEVHHRVKNNMQVVSSLLHIQTESIQDPAVIAMLSESQNRIRSMALIHESLYQSDNLLRIDFDDYLRLLTGKLNRIYETPGVSVGIEISSYDVQLDIERAVPCGLIVNELVSNSLKHAFKGRDGSGRITVRARRQDSDVVLEVCDDGVGFPEGVDFREMASMGMEIVCILAGQLKGTIELERARGTCFIIRFPVGDEDHSEAA